MLALVASQNHLDEIVTIHPSYYEIHEAHTCHASFAQGYQHLRKQCF